MLLALSYAMTRWESHAGQPSTGGGFGPMHLLDPSAVDGRGDPVRPSVRRSSTLHQGAALIHATDAAVRTDNRTNIRAGAALLASHARQLSSGSLPATTDGWYAAVARFSGATDQLVAKEFADDVFATLRTGAARSTSDGQQLRLAAQPAVRTNPAQLAALGLRATSAVPAVECPKGLDCRYIPAAYAQNNPADPSDYGNYDTATRPARPKISYIVIRDTEVLYNPTIALFQNPNAWLHDIGVTLPTRAPTITPRPGLSSVPVYGRAYPEPSAFAGTDVPAQTVSPLQYSIAAGQRYVSGGSIGSDYYRSSTFDGSSPGDHTVVRGTDRYILIHFGHRAAYVKASDVVVG